MTSNRMDELAAAWSTDDPDPALRAELEERLRRDPIARRQFLDHCVAEMALVESLASAAQAKEVTDNQEVTDNRAPLRWRPNRGSRRFTATSIALWAAGLAALLLIGILLIPGSDTMRVTAGSVVADGRTISAGGRLAFPLTSATAGGDGVELNDPAGIVLRAGPDSTFAIATTGRIRLESGQLTLNVDGKRAPPTAVHTDELVVNVVGTRFRVARSATKTDVDVQQGTVRVTTPDHTVRELTVGMRIAADATGFISAEPPSTDPAQPKPQPRSMRLIVITEDLSQRILEQLDQPIRLPADRPFTVRAEVGAEVAALTFRLASNQKLPKHPRRIEVSRPFDLWGDTDKNPDFSSLPAGTHHLTITFFADKLGEQPLDTRQFTVIAE
jgi:ferric-dicitrate binding protein FerR (iron transport regulator)